MNTFDDNVESSATTDAPVRADTTTAPATASEPRRFSAADYEALSFRDPNAPADNGESAPAETQETGTPAIESTTEVQETAQAAPATETPETPETVAKGDDGRLDKNPRFAEMVRRRQEAEERAETLKAELEQLRTQASQTAEQQAQAESDRYWSNRTQELRDEVASHEEYGVLSEPAQARIVEIQLKQEQDAAYREFIAQQQEESAKQQESDAEQQKQQQAFDAWNAQMSTHLTEKAKALPVMEAEADWDGKPMPLRSFVLGMAHDAYAIHGAIPADYVDAVTDYLNTIIQNQVKAAGATLATAKQQQEATLPPVVTDQGGSSRPPAFVDPQTRIQQLNAAFKR